MLYHHRLLLARPLWVLQWSALTDNYFYGIWDETSRRLVVIDPIDTTQIEEWLVANDGILEAIWLTHHHWDHIAGVQDLCARYQTLPVLGYGADAGRLPPLTQHLQEGDICSFANSDWYVMHMPGHTLGHIAYYNSQLSLLFSGDILFGLGCGRVFEGSPETMYQTLQRLCSLPPLTHIYASHEYSLLNADFAQQYEQDNNDYHHYYLSLKESINQKKPTVPFTLASQLATNPFLRIKDQDAWIQCRLARNHYTHRI